MHLPVSESRFALCWYRTVARKPLIRELYVCAGGLDIESLIKTPLICSVSYFNLGGLGALFEGTKPTKTLRGDGTVLAGTVS